MFAASRAAIKQFHLTFSDTLSDSYSKWDPDQIRIFEFHTRTFVAIIEQHFETSASQIVV
jgi:hypothetical protein